MTMPETLKPDELVFVEEWRLITGWESYEVSTHGNIRRGSKVFKISRDPKGYCSVRLSRDGKGKSFRTHRLVLAAFVGPCPEGHEGAHLDGNPSNNKLPNLAWVTSAENARQRVEDHKTQATAERHGSAKLTWESVRQIRDRFPAGTMIMEKRSVAREFGVCPDTIWKVATHQIWKHDPALRNHEEGQ